MASSYRAAHDCSDMRHTEEQEAMSLSEGAHQSRSCNRSSCRQTSSPMQLTYIWRIGICTETLVLGIVCQVQVGGRPSRRVTGLLSDNSVGSDLLKVAAICKGWANLAAGCAGVAVAVLVSENCISRSATLVAIVSSSVCARSCALLI